MINYEQCVLEKKHLFQNDIFVPQLKFLFCNERLILYMYKSSFKDRKA